MTVVALVDLASGLVENIIVADPETDPAPAGYALVAVPADEPAAIGSLYADGVFTPPAPAPEPEAE